MSKRKRPPSTGSTATSVGRAGCGHIHSRSPSGSSHSAYTSAGVAGSRRVIVIRGASLIGCCAFRWRRMVRASSRGAQNAACSDIHSCASSSAPGVRCSQCSRPRFSRVTRPAFSRTPICRDTPAKVIGNGAARSVMRASPSRRATRIARRTGSASAAYVASSAGCSITLLTIPATARYTLNKHVEYSRRICHARLPGRPLRDPARGPRRRQGGDRRVRRLRRQERARHPPVHLVAAGGRPHEIRPPVHLRRRSRAPGPRRVRGRPPVRGRLPALPGRRPGRLHRLHRGGDQPARLTRSHRDGSTGMISQTAHFPGLTPRRLYDAFLAAWDAAVGAASATTDSVVVLRFAPTMAGAEILLDQVGVPAYEIYLPETGERGALESIVNTHWNLLYRER